MLKHVRMFASSIYEHESGTPAWGAVLEHNGRTKVFTGTEKAPTAEWIAITSVIRGLENLREACSVDVVTDSAYVAECVNKYLDSWQAKQWKKQSGSPIENGLLWARFVALRDEHALTVVHQNRIDSDVPLLTLAHDSMVTFSV